ncbi:hypothetical protein BC332_18167 [Capsicum chinense]|nr:hypothetical protein BC332_18167 [Capsicum chinense]
MIDTTDLKEIWTDSPVEVDRPIFDGMVGIRGAIVQALSPLQLHHRNKIAIQADEDFGKIVMAVPLLVSKALELFLQDLCDHTYDINLKKGSKTMNSFHLDDKICNNDKTKRFGEGMWERFDSFNQVIYFDPIAEKFHMFPVPKPKPNQEENVIIGLGFLNECLCMTRLKDDNKSGVEILVMKEYGVKES